MVTALSDRTIDLVKKTVPVLEARGTAVTDRMYQLLFRNPDIRDLFNQSHHGETGSQPKTLAVEPLTQNNPDLVLMMPNQRSAEVAGVDFH